jgi:hypothetical protein
MTDLAYVAGPIVVMTVGALLIGYLNDRMILHKYPMPGDRGYKAQPQPSTLD